MHKKLEVIKRKCKNPNCNVTFEVLPGWNKQYHDQRCADEHRSQVQKKLWTKEKREQRRQLMKDVWKKIKEDEKNE